jgi:hypothetical protein
MEMGHVAKKKGWRKKWQTDFLNLQPFHGWNCGAVYFDRFLVDGPLRSDVLQA